jgi:hypothetical protein
MDVPAAYRITVDERIDMGLEKDDCKTFLSTDSYLKKRAFVYLLDNVNDIQIYYKNSNRSSSPIVTSFVITEEIKLPRMDDVAFLHFLEKKLENYWDIPIANSKNPIRYAFGNNFEKEIDRYSHPEIDSVIAKTASEYGGYYAPLFKKLGHMELVISRDLLTKNAVMLPPICLVYQFGDSEDENYIDELKTCQLFHKCFPEAEIVTIKDYELFPMNYVRLTENQLQDIKQIGKNKVKSLP